MRKLDSEKYLLGLQYFAENDETPADPAIGKNSAAVSTNDATASVISELTNQLSAMRAELDLLKPKALKAEEFQTAYQQVVGELENQKAQQERGAKKVQLEQGLIKAIQEYNVPVDVMESIVNSYKSEDDLIDAFGNNPAAALRAYHWDSISPYLAPKTKPLEVGKLGNNTSQNTNKGFTAEEFLSRKKSSTVF